MSQFTETANKTQPLNANTDLYTLMTVITHLTTCYAFRPCKPIADNIIRHLQHLLASPSKELLGEWADNFNTLLNQWQIIADHHAMATETEKMTKANTAFLTSGSRR